LNLAKKTYYLLQVHKINREELKSFPKSTGFGGTMSLNLQHIIPYTIFGIRTLIGIARTGTSSKQET
jgi:hypothetical protein